MSQPRYTELAEFVLFGNPNEAGFKAKMSSLNFQYRKGKTFEDVLDAVRKAKKPKIGHLKTELEIEALEMYLKIDVVKELRTRRT